jgi:ketosteroid isomerase-like protein
MDTRYIINNFLQALSARNLHVMHTLFADEVDWLIPGDQAIAPWTGSRTTKREVMEFFRLLWKQTIPITANIDHIFVDGKKAVISGDFKTGMLQTDKICDSLFFIRITVENGVIVKYHLLEDTLAVVKSLTQNETALP